MKRIKYNQGDVIGDNGLILIEEILSTSKIGRMGIFKCSCGNEFKTLLKSARTGNTTSCGCKQREVVSQRMFKHGKSKDLTFEIWKSIKARIFNKNNKGYKYYGGRGITIFPPWQVDFQLFLDYVSCLPHFKEKGYSIDRINNDGNYEPENLRWTTTHIQNTNQNKRSDNTTGYVGVYPTKNRWQIIIGGKYIGYADTKEQAVTVRNNYIIANKLFEYKIQPILSE